MEQILFAALVLVVGLLRVIMNVAEKKRNAEAAKRAAPQPQLPNAPVQRAPADSEEERIRRFMEALGVPANVPPAKPPRRVVTPKATTPTRPKIMPIDPFPAPRVNLPPPLPPVIVEEPAPAPFIAPPAQPAIKTATAATTVPTFEVADIEWGREESAHQTAAASLVRQDVVAPDQSWAARLATPERLRDAVIIREIFGAPRGLQPFEQETVALANR
ncbi:MAG: hypothetical protein ACJ8HU_00660 [Chthoniobacterales bacterium]